MSSWLDLSSSHEDHACGDGSPSFIGSICKKVRNALQLLSFYFPASLFWLFVARLLRIDLLASTGVPNLKDRLFYPSTVDAHLLPIVGTFYLLWVDATPHVGRR